MAETRFLLFVLALIFTGAASAEPDPCEGIMGGRSVVDVYDPSAPLERREQALQALREAAGQCAGRAYSLGLLYRHGADLPGNLLDADADQARALLVASAEDGNLTAYSDLAEMELQLGNAREAMKWTQVYLSMIKRYSGDFDGRNGSFDRSGYNADLLKRAEIAWRKQKPRLPRSVVTADLNAYLAGRTASIAARVAEKEARRTDDRGEPLLKVKRRTGGACSVDLGSVRAAYATYLLEVQPSGQISRIVLENFSPEAVAGERLKKCINIAEFEPFSSDRAETARFPVYYGYQGGLSISD